MFVQYFSEAEGDSKSVLSALMCPAFSLHSLDFSRYYANLASMHGEWHFPLLFILYPRDPRDPPGSPGCWLFMIQADPRRTRRIPESRDLNRFWTNHFWKSLPSGTSGPSGNGFWWSWHILAIAVMLYRIEIVSVYDFVCDLAAIG